MKAKTKERVLFKEYSPNVKPIKKVGNVLWFIFGGAISALLELLVGICLLFTIIGIPIGLQHFKCAKIHVSPFGKSVALHFSKHPILNTFYFIFGGFAVALLQYIIAGICYITIVGAPFGAVWKKIGDLNVAPFGAQIVQNGHTTDSLDTSYDFNLLCNRINADCDRKIISPEGEETNTTSYFRNLMNTNKNFFTDYEKVHKSLKKLQRLYGFLNIVGFIICFSIFTILLNRYVDFDNNSSMIIGGIVISLIPIICYFVYMIFEICFLHNMVVSHIYRKHLLKYFKFLFKYYTDSDKYSVFKSTYVSSMSLYYINTFCYPGVLDNFYLTKKSSLKH